LNDAGVESVEVKGPASLLYGSDALGGVLYFNLRNLQMRIPLKRT
jgi:iron complex outermembrane receptor protein